MKSIIFNQHQVNHALKNKEGIFRVVVKPCSVHPKSLCKKERGVHIGIEFMKDGFFWIPVGGCELQPFPYYNGELSKDRSFADYAKFKVGETIFVKESFSIDGISYQGQWYWADGNPEFGDWTKPKPAQHMKQEHSRLNLRIKSVKLERLQDISQEDVDKEGDWSFYWQGNLIKRNKYFFATFWNLTHKKPEEKWEENPWVFAYEYEVVR